MARPLLSERRVAPSILSADFSRLGAQVGDLLDAGARIIHIDVMDGHFVPPITIGPLVASALADRVHGAGGLLDVHLMIERPEQQISEFARAGADVISIHAEATAHAHRTLGAIRDAGCMAGLALNPATPPAILAELEGELDLALCMSVNPGWGGQRFIAASLDKLRRMRALVGDGVALEVDGGIDAATAGPAAGAGAGVLVAGSAIFATADPVAAYREIVAASESPATAAGAS